MEAWIALLWGSLVPILNNTAVSHLVVMATEAPDPYTAIIAGAGVAGACLIAVVIGSSKGMFYFAPHVRNLEQERDEEKVDHLRDNEKNEKIIGELRDALQEQSKAQSQVAPTVLRTSDLIEAMLSMNTSARPKEEELGRTLGEAQALVQRLRSAVGDEPERP